MSERPRLPHVPGAWLVGLAIAGGAMVAGLSYEQSRRLILAAQSEGEVALAKGLAVGLADPLVTQDYGGMEARLEQAMADSTIASALVIDPEGRVLVHLQRRRPTEPTELLFQPRRISPPRAASAATPASARWNDRWMAIEAGAPVGWLRLRIWSRRTDAVLNLLARQYLLLAVLAAALFGGLLLLGAQQLRRQSQLREQRVQAEREELDRSAHTDPLTGVWNRRGVERELQRLLGSPERRRSDRLAICMIDLDDFKPVNDAYGHAVGDQLLLAVARRMRAFLREDDLFGRLGGDEFIAVLRGCGEEELARRLAGRIIHALRSPFVFDQMQIRIGASIGIALDSHGVSEPMHALLQRADQAMYAAKHEGKGHVIVSLG